MMNKLVLKGDMDITFAGIVDIGEILMLIVLAFNENSFFSHTLIFSEDSLDCCCI